MLSADIYDNRKRGIIVTIAWEKVGSLWYRFLLNSKTNICIYVSNSLVKKLKTNWLVKDWVKEANDKPCSPSIPYHSLTLFSLFFVENNMIEFSFSFFLLQIFQYPLV